MTGIIKKPVKFNFISVLIIDSAAIFLSVNIIAVYVIWRVFFGSEEGLFTVIFNIVGYWVLMWVSAVILLPSAVSLAAMIIAKKMHRKGNLKGYRLFMGICYAFMLISSSFIFIYSVLCMGDIMRILLAAVSGLVMTASIIGAVNTFTRRILVDFKGE